MRALRSVGRCGISLSPVLTGESKYTPEDRRTMYREYVECALRDPRFVGTHWFRWGDQPLTGRGMDGENFSRGFLDICDSPYWELVETAREVGAEMYPLRYGALAAAVAPDAGGDAVATAE